LGAPDPAIADVGFGIVIKYCGRSIAFFDVTVTDSDGNIIASVLANGFRKQ
jgi:hypothetical protein